MRCQSNLFRNAQSQNLDALVLSVNYDPLNMKIKTEHHDVVKRRKTGEDDLIFDFKPEDIKI